jgi:hypothetical protein
VLCLIDGAHAEAAEAALRAKFGLGGGHA